MTIDLKNLPPMSTFIALEAVVRHLSFTRAAKELSVSPAAVSQQVKALEQRLGIQLIRRMRPQIGSTAEAEIIAKAVRQSTYTLEQAVLPLLQRASDTSLTVATVTAFSSFWLMPRLPRFFAAYPGIEVSLLTKEHEIRQNDTQFDVGIRYGRHQMPDLEVQELFRDELVPVCSRTYLADRQNIIATKDLANENLLHLVTDEPWTGWPEWFSERGIQLEAMPKGPQFSNTVLLIQAAVDGQGVALGWRRLIEPLLQDGRLVPVSNHTLIPDASYAVIVPKIRASRASVRAFRAWLFEEAQSDW